MNRAVSQMDETTQYNARLVEQAALASSGLSEQVTKVNQVIGFFRSPGTEVIDVSARRVANRRSVAASKPESEHRRSSTLKNGALAVKTNSPTKGLSAPAKAAPATKTAAEQDDSQRLLRPDLSGKKQQDDPSSDDDWEEF